MVAVSWDDAVAYCQWAELRLSTEAEWEKAARGPEGWVYPWGDQPPTAELCNFDINVGKTTPVGKYSPQGDSVYGCADMAGNLWEWVADWHNRDYHERSPEHNLTGPDSGTFRVLRGGSWYGSSGEVRGAHRGNRDPGYRNDDYGFRCVRSF